MTGKSARTDESLLNAIVVRFATYDGAEAIFHRNPQLGGVAVISANTLTPAHKYSAPNSIRGIGDHIRLELKRRVCL